MPIIHDHVHKHVRMLYCLHYTLYFGNKKHFLTQTFVLGGYFGTGSVLAYVALRMYARDTHIRSYKLSWRVFSKRRACVLACTRSVQAESQLFSSDRLGQSWDCQK
jgi:hypothetical protein